MDFSVIKEVDLKQFKMGDHVQFTLKRDKDNKYIVTGIKKLTP